MALAFLGTRSFALYIDRPPRGELPGIPNPTGRPVHFGRIGTGERGLWFGDRLALYLAGKRTRSALAPVLELDW